MSNQPIPYSQLSEEEQRTVSAAQAVLKHSYCPYSNFPVGCAILTEDGKVFSGCNVENAAWATICAERAAVVKAVSEGYRRFKACAIVCGKKRGGWSCGVCRQYLCEFSPDMTIINVINEENAVLKKSLAELLPESFGPHSL